MLFGQLHFVEGAEGDFLAAHGDGTGFVEQVVGGIQDQLAVGEFGDTRWETRRVGRILGWNYPLSENVAIP